MCVYDADCNSEDYCKKTPCNCTGTGYCSHRLYNAPCTYVDDPFCGCDGQTYTNSCWALVRDVNIDYQGSCNSPVCIDNDGDGAFSFCSPWDCNDYDSAIHTGATEILSDWVDQDCNGFDLTIRITLATYSRRTGTLNVSATSALGEAAFLEVMGYSMTWNAKKRNWTISLALEALTLPTDIVVQGPEGAVSKPVKIIR